MDQRQPVFKYPCPTCNNEAIFFVVPSKPFENIKCSKCDTTYPARLKSDINETPERHGSPEFYKILEQMGEIHNKKSHDYASNDNPFGNYHFAGMLGSLFHDSRDVGFITRLGEKLFRLANLQNRRVNPVNESIEDTETDICVICALWVASRRERRKEENANRKGD